MEKIKKIAEKFNLKFIITFGSKAKGKEKNDSDLDLAYYPEGDVDNENLYQDLMEHFKRADIDLIDLKKTRSHLFIFACLKEGKVLYEKKEGIVNDFLWKSYLNYKDFERFYNKKKGVIERRHS